MVQNSDFGKSNSEIGFRDFGRDVSWTLVFGQLSSNLVFQTARFDLVFCDFKSNQNSAARKPNSEIYL